MKLLKLKLHNFKGIRSFEFAPDGKSVTVFGDNKVGKTTLFDAMTWLLFDKDSAGRSTNYFSIKTKENGKVLREADHAVEGVFDKITLRKVYREKWVTKRGSSEPVHDGHTTTYYVDEEPVNMGEYQERVAEIMSEDLFKILTNPMYFPQELHWSDRRATLLDLCEDFDQSDIIATGDHLLRYPEVLGGKSQEAREKILKQRKKKLSDELDNIPSRIDENRRMIEPVEGIEDARMEIDSLKANKETIEAKRSQVKSGGVVADLNVKRQELQAEFKEQQNEHKEQVQQALAGQREKVADLQDKVDEADSAYREAKREYEASLEESGKLTDRIEELKKEIEQIRAREPKPANAFEPEKCPVCERPMEDAEEHDYEEYLDEFNAQKAEELKEAQKRLAGVRSQADEKLDETETLEQTAQNLYGKLNQRKEALRKAQKELARQKADQPDYSNEEIEQQIEDIDRKIADHRTEKAEQLEELDQLIEEVDEQIAAQQKLISTAEANRKAEARIKELQDAQKTYREELEQVESDLYLIEQYRRAESTYITEAVNDKFAMVEWKLFEEQINGGINDQMCEAMVGGIPFTGGLNNGAKIQAGIDIINTLARHYGSSAPVWVDNAESVTSLPETDLQIICLVVKEGVRELQVEPGLPAHNKKKLATA